MDQDVMLRINGAAHAFSRELGCDCLRCRTINFSMTDPATNPGGPLAPFPGWYDPPWRAHTSASILIRDNFNPAAVSNHIIIDAGAGVVDSLVCSRIENLHKLDGILITHWHPDHTLGLNQLAESVRRSCKRLQHTFNRIPVYTTAETYSVIAPKFRYEFDAMLAYHEITPGKPFSLPQVAGTRFTPIEVAHGRVRGSVIFLVEFTNHKKCLFLWDIDHPGATRLTDEKPNLDIILEYKDLLQNPDILFLETNGWKVNSPGHGSLINAQPYLDIIDPSQVILLHLSGHSDMPDKPAFGWSDVQWQQNIYRNPPHINHALIAGNQGMIIPL